MMLKCKLFAVFLFISFLLVKSTYSQVIYTPITSNIYNYLEKMADKGIIENYYSIVKPFSRNEIANYLKEIEKKSKLLNEIEKKELMWFENDYSYELNGKFNRWYLFEYADTLFRVSVTPIVDLQFNSTWWRKKL